MTIKTSCIFVASAWLACAGLARAQGPQAPLGFPGVRQTGRILQQRGIEFQGRYLGDLAANPAGGQQQGVAYAGELAAGMHVDLGRLMGWQGGSVNVLFTERHGDSLTARDINNSISVQEIYGGGETFQLTTLTFKQVLFGGAANVKLGRTELSGDFMHSKLYCQFENNALCGQPFMSVSDTNETAYPVAGWGGRIRINGPRHLYLKIGAYQDDRNIAPRGSHGFTWGLAGTNGVALPVEVGWQRKPKDAAFANRFDLGVIFDRSHFSPGFGADNTLYGRTLLYAQAQGRLWQAQPHSPRGLYGVVIGLVGLPADENPSNFEVNAALVDRGPLAARPRDSAGVSISETHASQAQLASVAAGRAAGAAMPRANLVMFEVNYAAQVTPWLQLTPNIQYIVNPDGGSGHLPPPGRNLPNAVVLGLQFTVGLPKLFGLPSPES